MTKEELYEKYKRDLVVVLTEQDVHRMKDIHPEVRALAVRWIENYTPTGGFELDQKVKLASDIMHVMKKINAEKYQGLKQKMNILIELIDEIIKYETIADYTRQQDPRGDAEG